MIDCRTCQKGFEEFTDFFVEPRSTSSGSDSNDPPETPRLEPLPSGVRKGKHNLFTRFPKDPNCEIRKRTKGTRAACRRNSQSHIPRETKFDDINTPDHKFPNEERESRNNRRYAMVLHDLSTQCFKAAHACITHTAQETASNLQKFLDYEENPNVMYTGISLDFGKACEDLQWNHCTSAPHRRETTGTAERAARRVQEGTSSVLLQSGLDEQWWSESMECCCYLRNVQDLSSDGKTSHAQRFEEEFSEPIIPFVAKVGYHPISAKGQASLHQFDKKVLSDSFMGHAPCAGGSSHVTVQDNRLGAPVPVGFVFVDAR